MIAIPLQAVANVMGSYTVPQPYSLIVAIIIIALTLWLGYIFIKDIIKVIFVLIALYLLASIGYSFLTTSTLSLSGIASFTTSIIDFFKYVLAAPHVISNITHNLTKTVQANTASSNVINATNTTR
ncbi:MAG: hypothetical protein RXR32_02190 [Candidatus Micrarchaeota archaeon]